MEEAEHLRDVAEDEPGEPEIVSNTEQVGLKKNVTLVNGIGLIVGSIIGSGIFISPTGVLNHSESIGMSLMIWLMCGIFSMLGALCYSELGTMIPKSGAEYSYLLDAFGPVPAFLFSWTAVLVIRPSAVAGIALVFAEYVLKPFYGECEPPVALIKMLAFICIAIITVVNCVSVKWAVRVQDIFTYAKLVCVAILTIVGIVQLGRGHTGHFNNAFDGTSSNIGAIGMAFYLGLWAYDGWNTLNYVTEEMKNPKRDLPLSIIISMTLVTGCYVLINVAYITVLGKEGILKSTAVALSVGDKHLGPVNWLVPVLVAASTFGAVNGCAFSNGRLAYAAAREGHLPELLAMVQTKQFTPLPSLLFTSLISCIMLIPDASKFETLIGFFSFASWVFYGACFFVLLYLRFVRPSQERPYKVFIGIPVVMLVVSLFLIITPILEEPIGSLIALAMILAGLPFYYIFVVSDLVPKWFKKVMLSMTYTSQRLCQVALPLDEKDIIGG